MTSISMESNMLGASRNLIGQVRASHTSIETRTYKAKETDYKHMVLLDSLCMSSLVDALIDASYLFGYRERKLKTPPSAKRMDAAREAYAFISGTGLENMIKFYDIAIDAENLRSKFMELWHQ